MIEAVEEIEITEELEEGTKIVIEYVPNLETNEVEAIEKEIPIITTQKTGKFRKQIKPDVKFNSATGKFIKKKIKEITTEKPILKEGYTKKENEYYRKQTRAEAEAIVDAKDIPPMPEWFKRID